MQTVVLDSSVDPESAANKGNVERWLLELEAMQWQSVRTQVTLSLKEYPTIAREQWVLNWPAQAVLGVSQVRAAWFDAHCYRARGAFDGPPHACTPVGLLKETKLSWPFRSDGMEYLAFFGRPYYLHPWLPS